MTIAIMIDTPLLSIPEYARRTGQSPKTVQNDMDSGLLPVYQRAKDTKRLVNMVALAQLAAIRTPITEPWNLPKKIAQL